MNILCIDQFSNIGGGQLSLLDLLPAFAERGWSCHLAIPGEGPLTDAAQALGVATHSFSSSPYSSIHKPGRELRDYACQAPRIARSLNSLVTGCAIDLLYVNGARFLPPAAIAAVHRSLPLVFHCHNRLQQPSAIWAAGLSLCAAQAQVIACCRYAIRPVARFVARSKLCVLFNGVADPINQDSIPVRRNRRHIAVLGRIEPEKGQLEFVHAAAIVSRDHPGCVFSVVGAPLFSGQDYYRRVAAAAAGLPVRFSGWQSDLAALYSSLDLLVVPSTPLEATTRVILEAYAAGVPVVAFPSGGIPEVLQDGVTGFLANGVSPQALASRITSVLRMAPAEVLVVVRNARRAWEQNFTLTGYRNNVCSVLSETRCTASRFAAA